MAASFRHRNASRAKSRAQVAQSAVAHIKKKNRRGIFSGGGFCFVAAISGETNYRKRGTRFFKRAISMRALAAQLSRHANADNAGGATGFFALN